MNRNRFEELKSKIEDSTIFTSSLSEIYNLPEYQEIIEDNENVLDYIKENLKSENFSIYWFGALTKIIGKNPVPPEYLGNVPVMKKIWLDFLESKK